MNLVRKCMQKRNEELHAEQYVLKIYLMNFRKWIDRELNISCVVGHIHIFTTSVQNCTYSNRNVNKKKLV